MLNHIIIEDVAKIAKGIDISKCEGKSFLITGANGLIARYIVETLIYLNNNKLKTKCKIIALCRNEKDAIQKFGSYKDREDFKLLIQTVEDCIEYHEKVDYIIHAASQANTRKFYIDPVGTLSANTIGTYNLLNYAKEKKIQGFLFISSGAIYGTSNETIKFVDENEYYEIDPLRLDSCYAEGKKMAENMCYCFYKQFSTPTKIVRVGHTYGPGINLMDGRVFSDFVKNILNSEDLIINSDGKAMRPFCYLTDLIIGLFLVLFKGKSGEAYNLANNECLVSINELAKILTESAFKERDIKVIKKTQGNETTNTNGILSVSTDKIYQLGWKPVIGIEEGFKRTVTSFEEECLLEKL